jgi:radical SAM protein with 4Fe4S-binding SPASM domain
MDCEQTSWLTNKEYFQQFRRKTVQNRIPVYGSLNLTNHCNLRCVHCYMPIQAGADDETVKELSTAQWINLIDEITEAGCLYLLITGGEPLLRKDFRRIYSYAKEKGLLVAVFTNGTLITEEVIKLFKELPPRAVEISLYGATAPTYERITGVTGSYEMCISGIRQLIANKINVKLKTVLMTLNRHEFYDMENMAKTYGTNFRVDAAIFPRFNGDRSPLKLRVPPEEVIEKESSDKEKLQTLKAFYESYRSPPATDKLYKCGAGLTAFHIDSSGSLYPCLMAFNYGHNLLDSGFLKVWREIIPLLRKKTTGADYRCNKCQKLILCGYCPGFFHLENNKEDQPSEYLCKTGHLRYEFISDIIKKGGHNDRKRAEEVSLAKL